MVNYAYGKKAGELVPYQNIRQNQNSPKKRKEQHMSNIKDLFVSYEIAKQLKDKGFNEPCLAYWHSNRMELTRLIGVNNIGPEGEHPLPLHQQVIDWFRTEKNIHIVVENTSYITQGGFKPGYEVLYSAYIRSYGTKDGFLRPLPTIGLEDAGGNQLKLNTYQEALTKAIEEAIKLI